MVKVIELKLSAHVNFEIFLEDYTYDQLELLAYQVGKSEAELVENYLKEYCPDSDFEFQKSNFDIDNWKKNLGYLLMIGLEEKIHQIISEIIDQKFNDSKLSLEAVVSEGDKTSLSLRETGIKSLGDLQYYLRLATVDVK